MFSTFPKVELELLAEATTSPLLLLFVLLMELALLVLPLTCTGFRTDLRDGVLSLSESVSSEEPLELEEELDELPLVDPDDVESYRDRLKAHG